VQLTRNYHVTVNVSSRLWGNACARLLERDSLHVGLWDRMRSCDIA